MKTQKLLTAVVVLQGLILAVQWTSSPSGTAARAEIMNPGERQLAILEESKQTNAKLEKILSYLQSGDLKVRMEKEEEKK